MLTKRDAFILALEARGERKVKETRRFVVYTRSLGDYYYLGRSGSLRVGPTIVQSRPAGDSFKGLLLAEANEIAPNKTGGVIL